MKSLKIHFALALLLFICALVGCVHAPALKIMNIDPFPFYFLNVSRKSECRILHHPIAIC